MMKTSNKLLIGLLVFILLVVTAFMGIAKYYQNVDAVSGSGNHTSQAREVAPFNGIDAKGRITVHITQGAGPKLEIRGDDNLIPLVKTHVDDGVLHIEVDTKISRKAKLEAYVSTESIQSLAFSAGASVETSNELSGETLTIHSSAGSRGNLALRYNNLTCESSAGSMLDLKGAVETMELQASAGAIVDAEDLKVQKCSAQGHAGAIATVNVQDELSANISSGSVFHYTGNPSKTNLNSSAGGVISQK